MGSMEQSFKRLEELKNLQEDWDSYGGQKISSKSIEVAEQIISETNIEPEFIAPISYGGVQLEYRMFYSELEIEIYSDGRLCYFLNSLAENSDEAANKINNFLTKIESYNK